MTNIHCELCCVGGHAYCPRKIEEKTEVDKLHELWILSCGHTFVFHRKWIAPKEEVEA